MECPKCGGAMQSGEVHGEEPREGLCLCIWCGFSCTAEGAAWPLEFDRQKWASPRESVQYDELGQMECPKCDGPMRCVEFRTEPAGQVIFICKWCGFSRDKGRPEP
jgi:hypothetical protein